MNPWNLCHLYQGLDMLEPDGRGVGVEVRGNLRRSKEAEVQDQYMVSIERMKGY